jgi:hypothetical protein
VCKCDDVSGSTARLANGQPAKERIVGPRRLTCKETMRFQTLSFEFDPATGEVHRDGAVYRLEPQPAALLALLLSRGNSCRAPR